MNVKLLEQVRDKLKRMRHSKHFGMSMWVEKTKCGTSACIAGHALLLSGFKPVFDREIADSAWYVKRGKQVIVADEAARELLGLTIEEADRLFYSGNWPYKYYRDEHNPKVAAARIDHFIKTKGKE